MTSARGWRLRPESGRAALSTALPNGGADALRGALLFCKDPQQVHGTTIFGTAVVTDIGGEALRALAHKIILEDPSGNALKLAETEIVVADVGETRTAAVSARPIRLRR